MRLRAALFPLLALLGPSCRSAPEAHSAAVPLHSAPAAELWVDAQAQPGGEGSAARPLRRLEEALQGPALTRRVHLASGLYPGPFQLPEGTELLGEGAAVLTAPAGVTVVLAMGAARLQKLLLQGGTLGTRAVGALSLSDVRFSGQRAGAVEVAASGSLLAEGVHFEASVSGGVGLRLEPGGQAVLHGCTFEGPWQRGIEAHAPQRLEVATSTFRGSVTALQLLGGSAQLADVAISEGRGPGLYVAGGSLVLRRVQVSGQEYALLTGSGAVVDAEELSSTRADRAGVGMVNSSGHFTRLTITLAGSLGGLQSIASQVRVDGLKVEDVAGVGISQRDGTLQLDGATVTGTRERDGSAADAVQLRGGQAHLRHLILSEASGACLTAAEGAEVVLAGASLAHCRSAGLVVESTAHLTASEVVVESSEGPAAVATGQSRLVLSEFRSHATEGVVWAECEGGAQVATWHVQGVLPFLSCLERLPAPPVIQSGTSP